MAINGKTIKQIADELGVTKQAVNYRLKQLEEENNHQKNRKVLAVKDNGILVVSLVGETLIKSAFSNKVHQKENIDLPPNNHQKEDDILVVLKTTIDTLQEQLEVKDKQIAELTETVKTQAQSINVDRQNQLAGTLIEGKQMIEYGHNYEKGEEPPKKKGWQFWKR